jgi:hypothetical protein
LIFTIAQFAFGNGGLIDPNFQNKGIYKFVEIFECKLFQEDGLHKANNIQSFDLNITELISVTQQNLKNHKNKSLIID